MPNEDPTPTDTDSKAEAWKAPADQAELDKIVETRLARERAKYADYDDVKAKATEFDKAQEASKTELQKATDRAAKAEASTATAQQEAWRATVALTKGLTPTQAKRLVGTTREELETDADELLKDLKSDRAKPPHARDQKQKTTTPSDDPLRETARQLFGRGD